MSIKNRYISVSARISETAKKNDRTQKINLLAVSKKQEIRKIKQLYDLGQRDFGESYINEAIEKIDALNQTGMDDIIWHFIGPLQSNKTKFVAQYFSWVQSVDSLKLLKRLNDQRDPESPNLNVLLQLKVGDESSKRGLDVDSLLALATQYQDFNNLSIRGLMCIPPPSDQFKQQIKQFNACKHAFDKLNKIIPVDTLSIGMSSDLEAAICAGSNMVRVGTDIFGERSY